MKKIVHLSTFLSFRFVCVISLVSLSALSGSGVIAGSVAPPVLSPNAATGQATLKPDLAKPTLQLNLDPAVGQVEFDAIGRPSSIKIHGKGLASKGTLVVLNNSVSGKVSFDLDSLDTGITMRNEHMKKKYLEIAKYGNATLTVTNQPFPATIEKEGGKAEKVPFQGVLDLHGVQKPVSGEATLSRNGDQVNLIASFSLKISDFSIPSPGFAGITMADEVRIAVQQTAAILLK